jgi:hypothetical protein
MFPETTLTEEVFFECTKIFLEMSLLTFFRININIVLYHVNSSSSANADPPNSIESFFISKYPYSFNYLKMRMHSNLSFGRPI